MRSGQTDEADALAARLHRVIVRKNTTWMRKLNTRKSAKDAWTKVREITRGTGRSSRGLVEGLTAEMFNAQKKKNLFSKFAYKIKTNKKTMRISLPTAIIVHRYPSTSLNYRTMYITEMDVFLDMNTGWRAQSMYVCMYVCI